jgi:hypothetical protein
LIMGLTALGLMVTPVRAEPYESGFRYLLNNSSYADDIAPQLSFTVQSYTGNGITNGVLFTIYNNAPAPSVYSDATPVSGSIDKVLFDDGTLLGLPVILDSPTAVDFEQLTKAGDAVLPDGTAINFDTSTGFGAVADNPASKRGINPGESLGLAFALQDGKFLADTVAALKLAGTDPTNPDSLRIGLHLISPNGLTSLSDSYVNTIQITDFSVVPLPASVLLGMLGMGAAGLKLRKFV